MHYEINILAGTSQVGEDPNVMHYQKYALLELLLYVPAEPYNEDRQRIPTLYPIYFKQRGNPYCKQQGNEKARTVERDH